MKKLNQTALQTGVIAGIIATLFVMGANAQLPVPLFVVFALCIASPVPIFIAGLGWGNAAAVIAVVTACVLSAVLTSPLSAVGFFVMTFGPAAWLSHLANLGRPASELGGPEHLVAWYPISDMLLHLCGLMTVSIVILGAIAGYGREFTDPIVDATFAGLQAQEPGLVVDPSGVERVKALMVLMFPFFGGFTWVMLMFAAYYIAVRITNRIGKSFRPRESMPSALRMNRHAIFGFLVGIVLTFLGGVPAMVGATICGAFGAGFLMAGFASIHFRAQGKDWRLPALILCYLSTMFVIPTIAILVLGLIDTRRTIALTPAKGEAEPKQTEN